MVRKMSLHEVSDALWATGNPQVQVLGQTTIKTWRLNQIGVLTVTARPNAGANFRDSLQIATFILEYRAFQREYYLIPPEHLIKPMSKELVSAFKRAYIPKLLLLFPCALVFGLLPTCFLMLAIFNNHPNLDATVLFFGSAIWLISSGAIGVFLHKNWEKPFQGYDTQINKASSYSPILLSTKLLPASPFTQSLEAVWVVESVVLTKSPPSVGFKNPSSTGRADGLNGTRFGQHQPLIKIMPHRIIHEGIVKCFGTGMLKRAFF